ncbi:MAG: methylmalonyl Co-A mutase-associated GTPase MeaB [Rhodospirillales bacterium]|nr:methylmalonyl Co-A mutase-associated GTPase MeaB [Rhodospirillales bacterium]
MVTPDWPALLSGLRQGDRRALSRLISLVEARAPGWQEAMHGVFTMAGKARAVGITGSLGTGKSTLTGRLAAVFAGRGRKVGILAVDPSSPFSGGAILGDRIRMPELDRLGVFLRSLATRGAHGGLSRATRDAVRILDAFGFDMILVETVGAGQDEVDVLRVADVTLVLSVPGQGDGLQAIKAGIMEIADVFVVNKADRSGADHVVADIQAMLRITRGGVEGRAAPAVLKTVATTGAGIEDVADAIESRISTAVGRRSAGVGEISAEVVELVEARLRDAFWTDFGARQRLDRLVAAGGDPYLICRDILPDDIFDELFAVPRRRLLPD